jgi:hypothetical protein
VRSRLNFIAFGFGVVEGRAEATSEAYAGVTVAADGLVL